jgi:hypothetical protein
LIHHRLADVLQGIPVPSRADRLPSDPEPPVVTVNIAGTNFPTGGDMQQESIAEGWGELARSNREA